MSRITHKEVREVEVSTLQCDICGSQGNLARYECNRICRTCGRDTCNDCQLICEGPTQCKVCDEVGKKYQPRISLAYQDIENLKEAWKQESLGAGRQS